MEINTRKAQSYICCTLLGIALVVLTASCGGGVDNTNSTNQLNYGDQIYPLESGLEERYSFSQSDTHSKRVLSVTDGAFFNLLISPGPAWGAMESTVQLKVFMHSPGEGGLRSGNYQWVSDKLESDDPSIATKAFFKDGEFGIDFDNNGKIDGNGGEWLTVSSGSIMLENTNEGYNITFDLMIENGVPLNGVFNGEFPAVN